MSATLRETGTVCSFPFTQQGIAGDREGKAGQQSTLSSKHDV